jgi:tRNA dimethylallyltransferase
MSETDAGKGSKTLIIILGPTAAGKTNTAIELAKRHHTHILSADSRQFYKELRIGSAMPSDAELREVPHHFVGHLSVHDYYNVSRYETDALQCIDELFKDNDTVFMCGGSGLYINAVSNGIDELPDPDEEIRTRLRENLRVEGIGFLQKELTRLDPEYYRIIDQNNPSRLIRAIEVCLVTGKTYSALRSGKPRMRSFKIIKIGLTMPKEELIRRICSRVDAMIQAGFEEEARGLYPFRSLNALRTVGYNELFAYFSGQYSLEEAIAKINTNTWRYAKRQLTWFRREKETVWFHPSDLDGIIKCCSHQP